MQIARIAVEINQDSITASEQILIESKRNIYITPSNFLEKIKLFIHFFRSQMKVLPLLIKKYSLG